MRSKHRRLLYLALPFLFACEDGTGPDPAVRVEPGAAPALSLVAVHGLPATYAADGAEEVTVGGTPTAVLYDPEADLHRLFIPDLAPGRAEIVIPIPRGRTHRVRVEVLPRAYVGGSPEAAVEEMDVLLDSLQVGASLLMGVIDAATDTALIGRLEGFLTLAEAAQQEMHALTPAEREVAAAIFSSLAPDVREVAALLSELVEEATTQPGMLPELSSATGPVSATMVVARCTAFKSKLDRLSRLASIMSQVSSVVNAAATFAGPNVKLTVTILTGAVTLAMDIAIIVANAVPNLIHPEGLALQVSPFQVPHDGGEGAMSAWVTRVAAGRVLGSSLSIVMGLRSVGDAIRNYETARAATGWGKAGEAVAGLIKDAGIAEALDYLDEMSHEFLRDAVLPQGKSQVTYEGLTFTSGVPSTRWEFVDGPGTAARGLRTQGENDDPVESVSVAARIGSGEGCTGVTTGTEPARGLNGFEIVIGARVRYTQANPVTVTAGSSTVATLGVRNEGIERSGALTYRLALASGEPFTPPTWLSVQAPSGPGTLAADASGTVRITVSAASDAPERSVVLPIALLEDGEVVDHAAVEVTVDPQLADIVVNRAPSTLRLWDYGTQDGDIVTVTLNGAPVASGLSLTNVGHTFPMPYRRGRNVLVVRAHNEGSLVPNTAALSFGDVVRGPSTQQYGLSTGGTAQLVITYDPDATAQVRTHNRDPAPPTYVRCRADASEDCRP